MDSKGPDAILIKSSKSSNANTEPSYDESLKSPEKNKRNRKIGKTALKAVFAGAALTVVGGLMGAGAGAIADKMDQARREKNPVETTVTEFDDPYGHFAITEQGGTLVVNGQTYSVDYGPNADIPVEKVRSDLINKAYEQGEN